MSHCMKQSFTNAALRVGAQRLSRDKTTLSCTALWIWSKRYVAYAISLPAICLSIARSVRKLLLLSILLQAAWTSSNMYLRVVDKVCCYLDGIQSSRKSFQNAAAATLTVRLVCLYVLLWNECVFFQVNNQQVSTFLTAGNIKFMLLHSGRNEDSIKNFFQDVYELYVKLSLNPFYRHDTPIQSVSFDTRVRAVARRYL
jgi:Sedlin, N-terminal conserved region